MRIRILGALAFLSMVIGLNSIGLTGKSDAAADKPLMVSHDVFFSLKEGTAENKKTLVEACHKYLKGHPGEVFYSAGVLAEDLKRSVNDLNFDVALHIVFNDKASQDKYQDAPRHLEFIEKNKSLWKSVRVFDSYVSK
jgi:hypothetical protein